MPHVLRSWLWLLAAVKEWESDIHNVLSRQPCSVLYTHAYGCSFMQSISYLVFLFSSCLLFFPSLSFPESLDFSWCVESKICFVIFSYCMFQDEFVLGPTYFSPFWQPRVYHVANYRLFGMKCSCFLDNLSICFNFSFF